MDILVFEQTNDCRKKACVKTAPKNESNEEEDSKVWDGPQNTPEGIVEGT